VSRSYRYLVFSLLYFAQGSVLGYFTALNALYLRSFDLSMTRIGLFSAIAIIPLILKIFWGMLSDKVNFFGLGYRKPYIVVGLLMQAGGQLIFPYIHPVHAFPLLLATGFFTLLGMALFDTCTDGFALDTTTKEEMGKIQGIMVAGRSVGIVLISAALGMLTHLTNWNWVFISLAVMTLIPLPFVLFLREPERTPGRTFHWPAFKVFGKKTILAVGLFGFLSTMITGGTNQLVNPFLRETFGISFMMAGFFSAFWGIGVTLGGLTGGRLIDRFGNKSSVAGSLVSALVAIGLLAMTSGTLLAWPLLLLFGLAYGYYETSFFATSMSVTDPRIAASMFAILMAMANAGSGVGMVLGGRMSDLAGFRWTFVMFAGLNLLIIPLIPLIFGKKRNR